MFLFQSSFSVIVTPMYLSHTPRFHFALWWCLFFLFEVHNDLLCLFCVKFKIICTASCRKFSDFFKIRCLIVVGCQACEAFIASYFTRISLLFSLIGLQYQRDHTALRGAGVCYDDSGCDIAYFHILVPLGKGIMNP